MKKQEIKSLVLHKKSISKFTQPVIKGGRTGAACYASKNCQFETQVIFECRYSENYCND
jgi:hypothetical protein